MGISKRRSDDCVCHGDDHTQRPSLGGCPTEPDGRAPQGPRRANSWCLAPGLWRTKERRGRPVRSPSFQAGHLPVPAVPSLHPTSPSQILSLLRTTSGHPGPPGAGPALGHSLSEPSGVQSHGRGARPPGHLSRTASKGLANQRTRRTGLSPGRHVEVVTRVWRGLWLTSRLLPTGPGAGHG